MGPWKRGEKETKKNKWYQASEIDVRMKEKHPHNYDIPREDDKSTRKNWSTVIIEEQIEERRERERKRTVLSE